MSNFSEELQQKNLSRALKLVKIDSQKDAIRRATPEEVAKFLKDNINVYTLELHESIMIAGICVMRVPSGWLYDCWDTVTDNPKIGTFVPFKPK